MDGTPKYRVLVHNDDATPMDFVVTALHEVFGLGGHEAKRLTLRIHQRGVAEVACLPKDEALDRVERLQALARRAGFPLTASVTPAVETRPKAEGGERTLDVSGLSEEQFVLVRELVAQLSRDEPARE